MDSPESVGPKNPEEINQLSSHIAGKSNQAGEVNLRPAAMQPVDVKALKGHTFTHEHRNVKNTAKDGQEQRMNNVFNQVVKVVDTLKKH